MVKLSDISRLMTRAFMGGTRAPCAWREDDIMDVLLSNAADIGLDPGDRELDLRLRLEIRAGRKYLALCDEERARYRALAGEAMPS
jgi:hypothetical protein